VNLSQKPQKLTAFKPGGKIRKNMTTSNWYQQLIKPSWAPPGWLFGPVWTGLYAIIAVSFGYAGYLFLKGQIPFIILLPFILNLIFNFAFTPIQFGLKNNYLAAIDILLILGTLIWAMVVIFPYVRWITYVNTPYLLWVSFATILQLTITYLNS
jgi:benzodiazapine receptor